MKVVGPLAVMFATGFAKAVINCGAEVILQPLALSKVTAYRPLVETVMAWVVAPFVHKYLVAGLAVMVLDSP